MGGCVSTPQASPGPSAGAHKPAGPPPVAQSGQENQQRLKIRVNDESGKMGFKRTDSGRVVLEVLPNSLEEGAAGAEVADGGGPDTQALRVLERMGLGLQFSPGDPFIGQLVLTVVEVAGLEKAAAVPRPYVVVSGESERSERKRGTLAEGGDSIQFEGAKFVFFVLFSNSRFRIALKGQRAPPVVPPTFSVGEAMLEVSQLAQGQQALELALLNSKGLKVGTVKVEADYHWLRGTRDDGTYTVVNRVVVDRAARGVRKTRRIIRAGVEKISQVNHWLLSHNNVWRVLQEDGTAALLEAPEAAPEALLERVAERAAEEGDAEAAAEAAEQQADIQAVAEQRELQLPGGDAATRLQCSLTSTAERQAVPWCRLIQETLADTLGPKEGDGDDVLQLKQSLLAITATFTERVEMLECKLEMVTRALQEAQQATAAGAQPPAGPLAGEGQEAEGARKRQGVQPFISGHFEYGLGRPASKRTVFMFMRKGHLAGSPTMHPSFLGTHKTRWQGDLGPILLPPTICRTPGHYEVIGMLPDDYSSAKGSLFVLQPGTKAVVFDMDGTITVGDGQVVTQFGLDALGGSTALASQLSHKYDLRPRRHALHVARAWAAKGYQVIYLSGRQGSYFNLTLAWLIKHRYPPGPIHLTRTHMPTLPVYFSVGLFKVKYLEDLKAKGIEVYAAYGNTPTDIRAYEAAGVPKERTFIVGPHGGKSGTVKVSSFTDHLPSILEHPDAEVPIPYTEILMSERPGYYRRRKVKGKDGLVREVSTVATEFSAVETDHVTELEEGASSWADLAGVNSDDEEQWAPSVEEEAVRPAAQAQAVTEGSAGEQQT